VASRSAIEFDVATESSLYCRAPARYVLREGDAEYPLDKNPLVVGRGSSADLALTGRLVSRRHAELHETENGLVVIDLDSRNGVLVNDILITSPTALLSGDKLTIGDNEFELLEVQSAIEDRPEWPEPGEVRESSRVPAGTYSGEKRWVGTRRADTLHVLGSAADKALALGNGPQAEHILGTHLVAALSDATAGRGVSPDVARASAQYAVKLALATGKPTWLDFAFRLYEALAETIPLPIVDEMYPVLRRVSGLDRELLRRYIGLLRARTRLSPPERFVLQRLEGLERLTAGNRRAGAPTDE